MRTRPRAGLFVAEGSSDAPLARIVEDLFLDLGHEVVLSTPDFALLGQRIRKDVESKTRTGLLLLGSEVDLVVVHRDADSAGSESRKREIVAAVGSCTSAAVVPVVPVRTTEAWLLLDEVAVRRVAGNPGGRSDLGLPKGVATERVADPKATLRSALLAAGEVTGRRRQRLERRFYECRAQLLDGLDRIGPVTNLPSWQDLCARIAEVADRW